MILVVILSLLVLLNTYLDTNLVRAANTVLIALIAFQVLTQLLIRKDYVYQAGLSLLLLSWVGITWFAVLAPEVREIALFAYVTILLSAGFLFGWRAVMAFGVCSILSAWLFAVYEAQRHTQSTPPSPLQTARYLTT